MASIYTFNSNIQNSGALLCSLTNYLGSSVTSINSTPSSTIININSALTTTQINRLSNIVYDRFIIDNQTNTPYLSSVNSTSTALGSSAIFNGTFDNAQNYNIMYVNAKTNVNLTSALSVSCSNVLNSVSTIISNTYNITANVVNDISFNLPIGTNFGRVALTNNITAQTYLDIQTYFKYDFSSDSYNRTVSDSINDNNTVQLNKTVLTGKFLDTYNNVSVNSDNRLMVDTPLSAFGLVKTQHDTPTIQLFWPYGYNPLLTSSNIVGTGSVSVTNGLMNLITGAAINNGSTVRSNRVFKYAAGQGGNLVFTALFDPGVAGNDRYIGVGSTRNGLFFGYNGTLFGILIRSSAVNGSAVDNWIYQSTWNIDKMDGTGPSKQLLNPTNGNVYRITFQWLGFGMLTFLMEETTTGNFLPVHKIPYANLFTNQSMLNPSFPMYMYSSNVTNTTAVSIKSASFAAFLEGSRSMFSASQFSTESLRSAAGSLFYIPLISIQSLSTFKNIENFIQIKLISLSVSVLATGNQNIILSLQIIKYPFLTAPVWNNVNSESSVQFDTVATALIGGYVVAAYSFAINTATSQTQIIDLTTSELYLDPDINTQTVNNSGYTIVYKVSSGSPNVNVSLNWIEDR